MKALFLFHIVALLGFSEMTYAQSETAHHRAEYNRINENEKSFKKVTGSYKDDPLVFDLTGYFEEGELRKIVAKSNEDGAGAEEYYLEREKPLFVFTTYYKNHLSKTPERIEERLYFREGRVFKWLTDEKPAPVFHGEDYEATTERLNSNCTAFVAALKSKSGDKSKSKVQNTEGVFTGIEQGDYAHWKIRTAAGEELSFFVLRPDASIEKVLEKPEAFVGRKCRVTWKTSTENIPEAGGKMEIEQILSVEWSGQK